MTSVIFWCCGFCIVCLLTLAISGYRVVYEVDAVAVNIREAVESSDELGKRARKRIRILFPLEKRKRELLEPISSLKD